MRPSTPKATLLSLQTGTRALLCALAVAAASPLSPAQAQSFDPSSMSAEDRMAFRDEVRRVLLEEPEIVEQALRALEKTRYQTALDTLRSVPETGDYVMHTSPEGADVTLIELTDYDCPYCRKAQPEIAELLKSDNKIRHYVVALPYIRGDTSERVVLAAKKQGDEDTLIALHKAMMSHNGQMTEEALQSIISDVGLDWNKLLNDMNSPEVEGELSRTLAIARALRIEGTPAFLIGDQLVGGLRSADEMASIVADVRAEQAKN